MHRNDEIPLLKDLKLPSDFETNSDTISKPVNVMDLLVQLWEACQETRAYAQVNAFVGRVRNGNVKAIVIASATVIIGSMIMYRLFFADDDDGGDAAVARAKAAAEEEKKKNEVEQRDFTADQLRHFDGKDNKPIYIALKGDVFDVSSARQFYGEGSGYVVYAARCWCAPASSPLQSPSPTYRYNCFAGRDATRAMAKLSFEESDLANSRVDDLGPFERDVLNDWYSKFKDYKCYPIVGRVSAPDMGRTFTVAELAATKAEAGTPVCGRVDEPLLVGINGKVIDVSYGGKDMYGKDGPYHLFVGIDASRALAKMSFKEEDLNSRDLSDLTQEQQKTLAQWEDKFIKTRMYPVVGTLAA